MANQLKMAHIDSIRALRQRNWSIRRIAKELGLHRDTVARHVQLLGHPPKPARAPLGSDDALTIGSESKQATPEGGAQPAKQATQEGGASRAKQATLAEAPFGSDGPSACPPPEPPPEPPPNRSAQQQASLCEPWRQVIVDNLNAGLTAQRIYQDLVNAHGFRGKYHSVRRFVRRLGQQQPLPFRRLECAAGEEAQVDFGSGIPIRGPDGRRRRTHVFRIVLSHSRKGYSEVVYRQTTEEFLRCLENAFAHFGGVPKVLVLDNLKAAVEKADWYDPELNPKLRSFADHYGLAILPTRPRTPRHKGKIESGIGYVKSNALRGHVFASLEEQNQHLLTWETTVADLRIHGTIRQQVGQVFTTVERPALLPLPVERFPFFHEGQRQVHRDGHVEVAKAYYTVPPEYLSRTVWVRWDVRLVRIFNTRFEQIAVHLRREPGRFSTQPEHIAAGKISGVERGTVWLLSQVERVGPQTRRWAEGMIGARGIEGVRVLQGLLSLAKQHPRAALEKACELAASHGSYRLRTLRALLKREGPKQEQFAFMAEHPIIRSLADYGQLVQDAFRNGPRIQQAPR
ncbi:MAG TPA: IS21 family transposase [Gemmataceae bacterium]|nr:IS21 family transposase [Gemmataceae bacterium]